MATPTTEQLLGLTADTLWHALVAIGEQLPGAQVELCELCRVLQKVLATIDDTPDAA
jgi:uncharacterized protein YaaN involved in tellurite resistance